ncbi:hypothetical protein HAX54_016245, partial [Datura stramonium]|nr:hypothetical protein [Datura stramonium]
VFPPMFARSVSHLIDQETCLEDTCGRRWRSMVCHDQLLGLPLCSGQCLIVQIIEQAVMKIKATWSDSKEPLWIHTVTLHHRPHVSSRQFPDQSGAKLIEQTLGENLTATARKDGIAEFAEFFRCGSGNEPMWE